MNASMVTASNAGQPLSPRGRPRLFFLGFRDARRAVKPDKGWTPATNLMRIAAVTGISFRREELGRERARLRVELVGIESELEAAADRRATAEQKLQSLEPPIDVERLPERAVPGDPKLVRSLTVAKAEADLRAARAAARSNVKASVDHRAVLLARQAQVREQISRLDPQLRDQARHIAAQADLRIAYYATVFTRWHKDREGLLPLLPFGRVSDEIDLLVESTSPETAGWNRSIPPTSASTRKG